MSIHVQDMQLPVSAPIGVHDMLDAVPPRLQRRRKRANESEAPPHQGGSEPGPGRLRVSTWLRSRVEQPPVRLVARAPHPLREAPQVAFRVPRLLHESKRWLESNDRVNVALEADAVADQHRRALVAACASPNARGRIQPPAGSRKLRFREPGPGPARPPPRLPPPTGPGALQTAPEARPASCSCPAPAWSAACPTRPAAPSPPR